MSKNSEIRQKILIKRKSLKYNQKIALDHKIYKQLLKMVPNINKKRYVGLYYPIANEVDTLAFIDYLLSNNYLVCLPYIKNKKMLFKPIESLEFKHEYWQNIPQPQTKQIVDPKDIDYLIVPVLVYNDENYRIGYGGHFYSKFLKNKDAIKTIGIAYHFQKNNAIDLTNCGKKLDKIIVS